MKFNFNRRLMTGKRVFNIWVQNGASWEALDDHTIYSVAVPKYLYDCNDNYTFREKITAFIPTPGPDLRTLVYHALKRPYAGSKSATSGEAPEYITSLVPLMGVWTPAAENNVCPQ